MPDGLPVAGLPASAASGSSGTHAARPSAATNPNYLYYETDTGLTFYSDGTNWQVLQPGQELGYAQITSNSFVTSAGAGTRGDGSVPLSLLSVPIGVRPVMVEFDADLLRGQTDLDIAIVWFMVSPAGAGTWTDIASLQVNAAASPGNMTAYRRIRQSLTPGNYDFKIQLANGTAGHTTTLVAGLGGNNLNGPAYLRVVSG